MIPLSPLSEINRLLIVKTSSLGDIIHALPVVGAIKAAKPDLALGWVVRHRFADLLLGNPAINYLHVLADKPYVSDLARLRTVLRSERYDCALDMQGLFVSGLITRLSNAPLRIGWDRNREQNALFLTHPIVRGKQDDVGIRHEVDLLSGFADALGIEVKPGQFPPQPYLPFEHRVQAAQWLTGLPKPRTALNVGAARANKRWPTENWVTLSQSLLAAKHSLVFVGSAGDSQTIAEIVSHLPETSPVADLSGRTTLRQLAAVLEACDLVVSGDSGPMHLAVAVGTPVIALFGATDPARHGPYGASSVVIQNSPPSRRRPTAEEGAAAMRAITPDDVLLAVERIAAEAEIYA